MKMYSGANKFNLFWHRSEQFKTLMLSTGVKGDFLKAKVLRFTYFNLEFRVQSVLTHTLPLALIPTPSLLISWLILPQGPFKGGSWSSSNGVSHTTFYPSSQGQLLVIIRPYCLPCLQLAVDPQPLPSTLCASLKRIPSPRGHQPRCQGLWCGTIPPLCIVRLWQFWISSHLSPLGWRFTCSLSQLLLPKPVPRECAWLFGSAHSHLTAKNRRR